jgi:fructose-1,6-bisphosphatase/inositol monophosphatase family enzyme
MTEKQTLEHALIYAANDAGAYLRKHAFQQGTLEWKKLDDPVTTCDKEAERIIISALERDAPGTYVGEEGGLRLGNADRKYYIDPIDGTKSWILRDYLCAVSIGLEEQGVLTGGVVYDFMKDIMYVGIHGDRYLLRGGVRTDGPERHEFLQKHPLSKIRLSVEDAPELHVPLRDRGYHTHEKGGSVALSMAELAAGNYDGMLRKSIGRGNSWDVAAGAYLLDDERFVKLDWDGQPFDYKTRGNGMLLLRREIADKVLRDSSLYDALRRYKNREDARAIEPQNIRSESNDDLASYGNPEIERLNSQ